MNQVKNSTLFLVIPKGERYPRYFSEEELSVLCNFTYENSLEEGNFVDELRGLTQLLQSSLSPQEHWMGVLALSMLQAKPSPLLVLSWLNDQLGYGVFAGEEIVPGTIVGFYAGEVIKNGARAPNNYLFGYRTSECLTDFTIDAEKKGNITRFINHAHIPNIVVIPVMIGGLLHWFFSVFRKIEKGEQLTIHYGKSYWSARQITPSSLLFSLDADQLHFEEEHTVGSNVVAVPHFSVS